MSVVVLHSLVPSVLVSVTVTDVVLLYDLKGLSPFDNDLSYFLRVHCFVVLLHSLVLSVLVFVNVTDADLLYDLKGTTQTCGVTIQ